MSGNINNFGLGASVFFTVGGAAVIGAGIGIGLLASWAVVGIVFGGMFMLGGGIALGIGVYELAKKAQCVYLKCQAEQQATKTAASLPQSADSIFQL
jgi:hypothetical protein